MLEARYEPLFAYTKEKMYWWGSAYYGLRVLLAASVEIEQLGAARAYVAIGLLAVTMVLVSAFRPYAHKFLNYMTIAGMLTGVLALVFGILYNGPPALVVVFWLSG